jgi:hypothetical protein
MAISYFSESFGLQALPRPVLLASRAHGFAVAVEILGNLLNVLRRSCCCCPFANAFVTEVLKAVLAGEAVGGD